jgi:hypothetical protein
VELLETVGGVVVMSLMQHGGGCYVICVGSEMLMMLCWFFRFRHVSVSESFSFF